MNIIKSAEREMTRPEIRRALGITRRTLMRWEKDTPQIMDSLIRRLMQHGLLPQGSPYLDYDTDSKYPVGLASPEKFPAQIRRLRANTDLGRDRFSQAYGIPYDTLKSWETGRRTPPGYVAHALMWLINCHDAPFAEPVEIDFK